MVIFLIGFMGSGKSHWGKIWAEEKGMDFFDLDQLLEIQEGKSILELFETAGEEGFREMESSLLRNLPLHSASIVACGGGTACYHHNMAWMNTHGTTVYLMASADELCERLLLQTHERPLLKGLHSDELHGYIAEKLEERLPYYLNARIHLPVDSLQETTIHDILQHKS
jgi:shikimate kinase